jgi:cob(I)alamin adenosyltransferase
VARPADESGWFTRGTWQRPGVGRLGGVKIYTRKGDDGTTGLLYGGRVPKDSARPNAYGAVDEAQAFIGLARAEVPDPNLDEGLIGVERDLWVVMAELAAGEADRSKLTPGESLVTAGMVEGLEEWLDQLSSQFDMPTEFVVPGQTRLGALLDVARTVVRRAERDCQAALSDGSHVGVYLNRLSDLLWMLARWTEGGKSLPARPH